MIGAIIQARMASTRLPGKVMFPVKERPMIHYLIAQLQHVRKLDKIVLATTTNKEDDPLVDFAIEQGINYFRGSEHDVLDRNYQTAKSYSIQHILRITGDCPLVDPEVCELVIHTYSQNKADYVYLGPSFAEGVDCEIISYKSLKKAHQNARLKSEREHVTLYFFNHPDKFVIISVNNKIDDSKYRFTLDEDSDFKVIKAIIEGSSQAESAPFKAENIKSFLDHHPKVFQLNQHIVRNEGLIKSLNNDE